MVKNSTRAQKRKLQQELENTDMSLNPEAATMEGTMDTLALKEVQDRLLDLQKDMHDRHSAMYDAVKQLAANSHTADETLVNLIDNVSRSRAWQGKPAHFSGKPRENPVDFLRAVKNYATLQNLSDSAKLAVFQVCLAPKPARWLESYLATATPENKQWKQIEAAFLKEYGPSAHGYVERQALIDRTWQPGETLETYIDDLQDRFALAGTVPELQLDKFLAGLPRRYRAKVIEGEPVDFKAATKLALSARTVFKVLDASDTPDTQPSTDGRLEAKIQALTDMISTKLTMPSVNLMASSTKTTPSRQNGFTKCPNCGGPHPAHECQYSTRVCWNCKQADHMSRDCPRKRSQSCTICGRNNHPTERCRNQRQTICQICGKRGHTAPVCRSTSQSTTSSSSPAQQIFCLYCGQMGHVIHTCPLQNQSRQYQVYNPTQYQLEKNQGNQ